MKVFVYLVEPAQYTVDLTKNIYDINKINYCFIKKDSYSKSIINSNKVSLESLSFQSKFLFLIKTFKNNDFIIINGYNNYPFVLNFMLNLFSVKKKYIAIESDSQLILPNNFFKRLIKWLYLSVIFKNKYILGFSGGNYSHKKLFSNYGMNKERINLMPMMVNNSRFFNDFKSFPETFTFLYVGRLVEIKNVENLIIEFNRHFTNRKALLKIVGAGTNEKYLKDRYSSSKILFLGSLFSDELTAQYHSASCFVIPSIFEPWGLVINEALSSGLPVISLVNIGANEDLIINQETGRIANNMLHFGKIMVEFYNNPIILKKYSYNAKELMNKKWNYDFYYKCLSTVLDKFK